jgi:hypothetical protein
VKRLVFLTVVLVLLSSAFLSCVSKNKTISLSPAPSPTVSKTPVPTTTPVAVSFNATSPDDIFPTPGGDAYAANVFQQGVANPWPPVEITMTSLAKGTDLLLIGYRKNISTKAGQTRNNIIQVSKSSSFLVSGNLSLYSLTLPQGIELGIGGGAGRPGLLSKILSMKILPDVASGNYTIQIGIELDSVDYGTLPCTINVIQ